MTINNTKLLSIHYILITKNNYFIMQVAQSIFDSDKSSFDESLKKMKSQDSMKNKLT